MEYGGSACKHHRCGMDVKKNTSRTSFLHVTHIKGREKKLTVRRLCSQHGRTRPVVKMKTTHGQVCKEHCANVTNFHEKKKDVLGDC